MKIKNLFKLTILTITFLVMGSSVYSVSTEGLVAYYSFSGNATDMSGNGNDGTVSGATLTTDRNNNSNSAYSFDGVNDYITSSNINLGSTFTIVMWGYKSFWDSNGHRVMGGSSYQKPDYFTFMDYDANDGQQNRLLIDSVEYTYTEPIIPLTGWHQFIMSIDNTEKEFKVYQDGILLNTNNFTGTYSQGSQPLIFGKTFNNYYYWDGKIDDISIWNRTLSQSEITDLYNNGLGEQDNCPISEGQIVNESITFEEGTTCNLPNGFSIEGNAINFTCNGAIFNSEDYIYFNSTGGTSIVGCEFNALNITIDPGYVLFTNVTFDGYNFTVNGCDDNCSFYNVTLRYFEAIISGGSFTETKHIIKEPTSGTVWSIKLPSVTSTFEQGIQLYNVVGINNISLDCNGGIINGSNVGNSTGIYINTTTDVTIKNCMIQNYDTNVYMENFDGDSFINNTLRYALSQNWFINSANNANFQNINILK